jgi:hypothetical protein
MAKEVRHNFGTNGVKTVQKANTDSSGSGNAEKEMDVKPCVPNGLGTLKRNEGMDVNMETVKIQVDSMKTSAPPRQTVILSPQESLGVKNFSTDSNSSGVQSNSYSDLSENGGCMTHGMEATSPEGTHRNLIQHISRGKCKDGSSNVTSMSFPQYPPPHYDALNGNAQTGQTYLAGGFSQSKQSIDTLSQNDHRYALPSSTQTYPYPPNSSHQYCSTTSGNRLLSNIPTSNAQMSQIQIPKHNTLHGSKQSNNYAYQPTSGKVQLQRSSYDLRQSSAMAEVPMRSAIASNESIDESPGETNCRIRYGINSASRS